MISSNTFSYSDLSKNIRILAFREDLGIEVATKLSKEIDSVDINRVFKTTEEFAREYLKEKIVGSHAYNAILSTLDLITFGEYVLSLSDSFKKLSNGFIVEYAFRGKRKLYYMD